MKPHGEEWKLEEVIVMHGRHDGQKEAREVLGHAAPDMARALLEEVAYRGHTSDCSYVVAAGGDASCSSPRCRRIRAALTKAGVPLP